MPIDLSTLILLQETKVSAQKVHTFPRMHALSKTGSIRVYDIIVEDMGDHAVMTTRKKVTLNGKWTEDKYEYWEGVNIGKSNETTYLEQALSEAQSAWNRLKDAGFTITMPNPDAKFNTDANGKIKPMLAIHFNEKKIKFPCLCQPKYDGCIQGGSKIITDKGIFTIRELVERRLNTKVLTQLPTGELRFRRIIGWANNGSSKTTWYTIKVGGRFITCTGNHRLFTQRGYVRADELLSSDNIICRSMSPYAKEILTGMLFGDSFLSKDVRSNSWRTYICSNKRSFALHKANLLGIEYGDIYSYTSGYGSECYRINLEAVTNFIDPNKYMEYRSKKFRRRKRISVKELLEMLTDNSLSVWYADDGSLMFNNGNRETPRIVLNTQRYSLEQLREFIKFFVIRYDCCPTMVKDKRLGDKEDGAGRTLVFTTEDTFKLLNVMRNRVLHGVEYKYYYSTYEYMQEAEMYSEAFSIDSITSVEKEETRYDLEVEETHNYFANGVLVHNCRMTISEDNSGNILFLSRKGKPYKIPHLEKWANENRHLLPLDGELYNHKELSFQEIISAVKRLSDVTPKIRYVVYDRPIDGVSNKERWRKLVQDFENVDKDAPAYRSDWVYCDNMEQVWKYHEKCVADGYEGVIIRNLDGKYEFGFRSNDLIKLKTFDDAEFEIIDIIEATGRDAGTSVMVLRTSDGNGFNAKPQGSRELRAEYLKNRKNIIGKWATVQYQGLSDDGVPRFPSLIAIRDYE